MADARLNPVPSTVRAVGDRVVTIDSGKPWPGVYRGSKYSIVQGNGQPTLKLNHRDIQIDGQIPDGLHPTLQDVGKSGGSGLGSIRVTADRDVLTKVRAENYPNVDEALVSEGWIPVYLGKLSGTIDFGWLDNDPDPGSLDPPCVWEGLPFRHGERWSVAANGGLEWRRRQPFQFQFPSSYRHRDLVRTYQSYRDTGGRLRVNEHGHIWMEFPNESIQDSGHLRDKLEEWYEEARDTGRTELLNLIHRRLTATGAGDPQAGCFPLYLGHVSQYDDGNVPTPVITDKSYYLLAANYEDD